MDTQKKKYRNAYAKALAECETQIIKDFPNRIPFICFTKNTGFTEHRNWEEIGKEYDKIKELYRSEFPNFDMREKGWVYIHTRQGKKRVFIE